MTENETEKAADLPWWDRRKVGGKLVTLAARVPEEVDQAIRDEAEKRKLPIWSVLAERLERGAPEWPWPTENP